MTDHGNVTCGSLDPTDDNLFLVPSGQVCQIQCQQGWVSKYNHESRCLNGIWSNRKLECVRPDALVLIGGRSVIFFLNM